jgi:hypothetical protein
MSDSSNIENALVALLLGDATLMSLVPDGVFMDEAGPSIVDGKSAKRFVIVSLVDEHDTPIFEGRASEDALYLVEARALSVINGVALPASTIKAAAARIDALLDPQPPLPRAVLNVPGYGLLVMRRVERVRMTEVDAVDSSIRWQRRGGRYQVLMAVASGVVYGPAFTRAFRSNAFNTAEAA